MALVPVGFVFQGTKCYGGHVYDHGLLDLIYPTGI